jgi:transcriptional regulator with XRE-family HTH domain
MSECLNLQMLGKRIRDGRLKMDMTQFALAEEVGVSQNFLGDVERGLKAPSITTSIRLANVLGISLDVLFSDSLTVKEDVEDFYITDKQLSVLRKVVKDIKNNFYE